jgi:hypothetical protein
MAKAVRKVSTNPLPVSFQDFAKKPVAAVAFLCICGITYLFVDLKGTFKDNADRNNARIERLEYRDSIKTEAIRKCDSSLASTTSKLQVLSDLNKIK